MRSEFLLPSDQGEESKRGEVRGGDQNFIHVPLVKKERVRVASRILR